MWAIYRETSPELSDDALIRTTQLVCCKECRGIALCSTDWQGRCIHRASPELFPSDGMLEGGEDRRHHVHYICIKSCIHLCRINSPVCLCFIVLDPQLASFLYKFEGKIWYSLRPAANLTAQTLTTFGLLKLTQTVTLTDRSWHHPKQPFKGWNHIQNSIHEIMSDSWWFQYSFLIMRNKLNICYVFCMS